jgi:nitrite reductase/ring-hydroxylating ferredoxin subunit
MGIFKRLLGICDTQPPTDSGCWSFEGGLVTIDLSRVPELKNAGGAVRFEGNGLPERVLVLKGSDGKYHAFRNKCTHAGRRLDPAGGGSEVCCCSVGKSTFDFEGKNISGSAKNPATVYKVEEDSGKLIVQLG